MQRILGIDDDHAITSLLKRGLSYERFTVDTAATGPKGLAIARDHAPELVILDVMLPGLDGFDVLARPREGDLHLSVLMLTARDAPLDQVKGLEAGADDYVVKPFSFGILVAHVRALLRRHDSDRPEVLRFADLALDTGTHRDTLGTRRDPRDRSHDDRIRSPAPVPAPPEARARHALSHGPRVGLRY